MGSSPQQDLSARLKETNEEYRRLAQMHADHSRRLDELSSRRFPTPEEQIEEARLKKVKLQLKDRMYLLMREFEKEAS